MHCSYSESRLDAYVDGTLPQRERARVAAHLARCPECSAMLAEFRVIDALLLRPRQLEPAENFTFKVMADARTLPRPHRRHTPALPILATYVAFGWATIGAFLWWGGAAAATMLGSLGASLAHAGIAFGILTASAAQLFGPQTSDVTRTMGAILGGDITLAAALAGSYFLWRSRRAVPRAAGPG